MMNCERNKAMKTFSVALQAFKHPLTLLNLGLLLLNDHVLKAAVPSWLTGKLSDFAGLFFFPFLLAAILAFPLESLRLPPRRIMALSCCLTALWFTLIKTAPFANQATETFASWLVGGPAQIVLDPTDLIALVVIAPAWRLWTRLEQTPSARPAGKLAYAALGLAALASIATSPCMPPSKVVRVVAFEGNLYARLNFEEYSGQAFQYAWSEDEGQKWEQVDEAPEEVAAKLKESAALPVVVCGPADAQHCYRVNGGERVEESKDGGASWQAAWEIPAGRRKYMERWINQPLSCGSGRLDMGPYDIALFEKNGQPVVVVAMGNEGALVRNQRGEWERRSVLGAGPTPFEGGGLFITLNETLWSLAAAVAVLLGYSATGWHIVLRNKPDSNALNRLWFAGAGVALFVVCLSLIGALGQVGLIGMLIAVGLVLLGLFLTWGAVAGVSGDAGLVWLAGGASLATAIAVYFVPTSFFDAWAAGQIAVYAEAMIRALGISIPIGVAGLAAVAWLCRQAALPKADKN
jgi:hypothetical protein